VEFRGVAPQKATSGASGYDIEAKLDGVVLLDPGQTFKIPTGIFLAIPPGLEGQVRSRSGLASKGVVVANSPGTIDSDYRGEVCVLLHNQGDKAFLVESGMRIAQLVFAKVADVKFEEVQELDNTSRGSGGFGSTGG